MATIYTRYIQGIKVRLGKYSDNEFVIDVGSKLYAIIDNLADAYREYNAVNSATVEYVNPRF